MEFNRKLPPIVAERITEEFRANPDAWPDWLKGACDVPWPSIGAITTEGKLETEADPANALEKPEAVRDPATTRLVVYNFNGAQIVDYGHWIVREPSGLLLVMADETFRQRYGAADDGNRHHEAKADQMGR